MKTSSNNSIFKTVMKNLTALGTRQGAALKKAYSHISSVLTKNQIPFRTETYRTALPVWKKWSLKTEKGAIPCLPTGLTSGTITNAYALVSSLVSSRYFLDMPHVNVNPKSSIISRANFSFAPSLAISRESLKALCNARNIRGELRVEKKMQDTRQILIGNTKNPKKILFSHFDSVGTGAADNASGTALMLQLISEDPQLLNNNLFVLDGNEELSYDYPVYWGRGYRNFEKKYARQISKAKRLIVVDCIGYAPTEILSKGPIIKLAFPIQKINLLAKKIVLITSDYDTLMGVYHSDDDTLSRIKKRFIDEALEKLKMLLK